MTFPGRITPAGDFFGAILDALEGADVQAVGADRFRRAEAEARMSRGIPWRRCLERDRGERDGGWLAMTFASFQAAIIERRIKLRPGVLFPAAISGLHLAT